MISAFRLSRLVAGAVVALSLSQTALAQEISAAHLAAARAAVTAIHATDQFDPILLQAGEALKVELIRKNPDLTDLISTTVDDTVLALVPRRGDLEKEVATIYAKTFAEGELNEIATFYNSPTGKKLISDGPIATREVMKAVDIWQKGVARDLAEKVGTVLQEKAPKVEMPAAEEKPQQ